MTKEVWNQLLHMMIHTETLDNWVRVMLFTGFLGVILTLIGLLCFLKKLGTSSFMVPCIWILLVGTALVLAERSMQCTPEMDSMHISNVSLYLWWAAYISTLIVFAWILYQLYSQVWNTTAYTYQLLSFLLLAIFRPTFTQDVVSQIAATPETRLYTIIKYLQLPRWSIMLKNEIRVAICERPSITNMLLLVTYFSIGCSFLILIYKIMNQFYFKESRMEIVNKILHYGLLVPLYFHPVPTIITIGILPFTYKQNDVAEEEPSPYKWRI